MAIKKGQDTPKFDFKDYYDPDRPYYFFTNSKKSQSVAMIRRIGGHEIVVDHHEDIMAGDNLQGFIVIKNNQGILHFNVSLLRDKQEQDKLNVVTLKIDPKSIKVVNRREYYRVNFKPHVDCKLQDKAGNISAIDLLDLSAGGVGVYCQAELEINRVYQILIPLPILPKSPFKVPIIVLHDNTGRYPREKTGYYYGASFVADDPSTGFETFDEDTRASIIRFINNYLIEQRRLKRDE